MKKAFLFGSIFFAIPTFANENFQAFTLEGCTSDGCEIFYQGDVDTFVEEFPAMRAKSSGKGKNSFIKVVADAADATVSQVSAMLDSARQTMYAQGYTHYTGTLHNKDGSTLTFNYSFATGDWTFSKKSSGGIPSTSTHIK